MTQPSVTDPTSLYLAWPDPTVRDGAEMLNLGERVTADDRVGCRCAPC